MEQEYRSTKKIETGDFLLQKHKDVKFGTMTHLGLEVNTLIHFAFFGPLVGRRFMFQNKAA